MRRTPTPARITPREEEEEEIDDSKPIDTAAPIPEPPPVRAAAAGESDADIFVVDEATADEDIEGTQGYELEEEEEVVYEDDRPSFDGEDDDAPAGADLLERGDREEEF